MRFLSALFVLSLMSSPVFAAKAHREAMTELNKKAKEGAAEVKANCGCAATISIDQKSFDAVKAEKVSDFKSNVGHEIKYIGTTTKEFCSDAESKKLFCKNVKKISVHCEQKGDVDAKYDERGKSFAVYTTSQMNSGGYKMKSIMESW